MTRYWKTILAAVAALGTILNAITNDVNTALQDNSITMTEWWFIGIAVAGAIGVYAKANTPPAGQPSDPDISETAH